MPIKALSTDLPIRSFLSAKDLEVFLEREHTAAPGFHLKLAKKSSGISSVSTAEAVEVALCFGWIDGQANGIDDKHWLVRYTPRRSKSIWSQKNVSTIGRLLEEGRLRPAGIAAVEAAKADGRWERAYAGSATMTIPDDLATALALAPNAASFLDGLNKTNRYAVLWRVHTASPQSRAKRIETLVQMLVEGKLPGQSAEETTSLAKIAASEKARARKPPAKGRLDHTKVQKTRHKQDDCEKQPRRTGLRPRT